MKWTGTKQQSAVGKSVAVVINLMIAFYPVHTLPAVLQPVMYRVARTQSTSPKAVENENREYRVIQRSISANPQMTGDGDERYLHV